MNVLIVRNQANGKANEAAFSLCAFLEAQGCDPLILNAEDLFGIQRRQRLREDFAMRPDLTVVLGGDGTIIRTASFLQGTESPILGINFGHLGFLANDSDEGVLDLVSRALADELYHSRRSCLAVSVECEGRESSLDLFAVNELALTRGTVGRTIECDLMISDVKIARLKGDGVIVASATGSTGYALAAGGPLVTPGFSGMIVQPLVPHTLMSRAMLTDSNDIVEVRPVREEDGKAATLTLDGDTAELDSPVSSVQVKRSPDTITLLYAHRDHFLGYSAQKFFGMQSAVV